MTHAAHVRYDAADGGPGRIAAELRAARMVWRREMLHFVRDRTGHSRRAAPAAAVPVRARQSAWAAVRRAPAAGSAADYLTFLFPGVLVMAAQPAAISVGASIVWDRESGFLREMLVAPVSRGTLLTGKCVGGATVATCQGMVVLASARLIHVPYRAGLFALLLAELALTALAMTVLGALIAVLIRRARTFTTVLSVLMTPLIFLSGLMFPVAAMPAWMSWLTLADPLTYAVDAMRRTIGVYQPARRSSPGGAALFEPVTWGGLRPTPLVELAVVAAFTVLALVLAARRFSRSG